MAVLNQLTDLDTVYYLPGAGGQLATSLGQALRGRGFNVTGRETRGEFRQLGLEEQLHIIREDLESLPKGHLVD